MKETANTPPSTGSSVEEEAFLLHPLNQATVSLHTALHPLSEHVELTALAKFMEDSVNFEQLHGMSDPNLLLAAQTRVLDALFNRFIIQGFGDLKSAPRQDCIKLALLAQRQCAQTVDRLHKHARKTSSKMNEPTEGRSK